MKTMLLNRGRATIAFFPSLLLIALWGVCSSFTGEPRTESACAKGKKAATCRAGECRRTCECGSACSAWLTSLKTRGGDNPLILIDGKEATGKTIGRLDGGKVKNITVLKDAAATAVYGAEGRDGVILIETKGSSCDGRKAISRIENLSVLSSCRNKDFAGNPLILIDGKEATGKTIACLDGGKVKNIKVLRDAAATAVYGTKGHDGVISIETEDASCDSRKEISRIENPSFQNKDFAGDPLILIDGKEATGKTISRLDGGKVKNITVLRDAAATAVYGAKGRGGVILIETKGSSCDGRKAIGRIENLSVLSLCRNKDFAGDPLILIDGKEATGKTIGCLDGGKVKNITVLRDAAATAVYGAKGRGGVISIETED